MTSYGSGQATDPDCLFCRIIRGEIPSKEAATTERCYAFADVEPGAPVHVLVVPKRHIASAAEVTAGDGPLLAEMLVTAQQVAADEGIGERGYRLVFNVGEDALNSIPHLHLHVLGGRAMGWPPG